MSTRRAFLKTSLTAGSLALWAAPINLAFAKAATDRRLVVVILRGALDGLAAVPPYGDPDYKSIRANLALDESGPHALLRLDGFFGLHPALTTIKALYDQKQAVLFHAIASPYRDRSHFDGQNVLESGGVKPDLLQDGWLNRALAPMGDAHGTQALAVSNTMPLMLDGKNLASSWMPTKLPEADDVFLRQIASLYAGDPVLNRSLADGIKTEAEARAANDETGPTGISTKGMGLGGYGALTPAFDGAGRLLARQDGPRIAVLEASGWDTHVNEGTGDGQLARRLFALDQAVEALQTALGPAWDKTAIVMATEFGRTAHPNGGGGTDHGTGGAAFLMGGAVSGGRVIADWKGLSPGALRDNRDLAATTDLRALFKGLLADHMGVGRSALDSIVFPDSGDVRPFRGLIRA